MPVQHRQRPDGGSRAERPHAPDGAHTLLPGLADGRFAADLLGWYQGAARDLPWRRGPGHGSLPDAYAVWLSEVMLQQTTVAAVAPRFERFMARWPDIFALAAADPADVMAEWAGLGYYARARNLLACAARVAGDHDGCFPDTEAGLASLPGIGGYTAAAIAAIAFGRRAVVVDANIARIAARVGAVPLPPASAAGKAAIRTVVDALTPHHPDIDRRHGDLPQAMMDLGSSLCTAARPLCPVCPVAEHCAARAAGIADRLPVPTVKAQRPVRHGILWWVERDGAIWLVRREGRGLLGGMRALPTTLWDSDHPPPGKGATVVRHAFTHFVLEAAVEACDPPPGDPIWSLPGGRWWPLHTIDDAGLPTVFARAVDVMRRTVKETEA